MMGNYHVRFLGGKGVVTPLPYPVNQGTYMYLLRISFNILLIVLLLFSIGCSEDDENLSTQSTNQHEPSATLVSEPSRLVHALIDRYSPSSAWSDYLKKSQSEPIYTVHLQNILDVASDKPFLFFGQLKDIQKKGDGYIVRFDSGSSSLFINIYYELKCDQSIFNRLISIKEISSFIIDDFAIVASLDSVSRPAFMIDSHHLESGGVEIDIGIDKIFLVTA